MHLPVVFCALLSVSMAQRPSFAGSGPIGVPKLASRFQNTSGDSSTTAPADLANRIGGEASAAASTSRIPTDARGDAALVDRLNSWPRENRPFWLLNADHIEKHRHPNGGGPTDSVGSAQNSFSSNQGNGLDPIPVGDRDGQGQFTQNRGSFGQEQLPTQNSFTVFDNNRLKTYVYDPVSDSWKAMSN